MEAVSTDEQFLGAVKGSPGGVGLLRNSETSCLRLLQMEQSMHLSLLRQSSMGFGPNQNKAIPRLGRRGRKTSQSEEKVKIKVTAAKAREY